MSTNNINSLLAQYYKSKGIEIDEAQLERIQSLASEDMLLFNSVMDLGSDGVASQEEFANFVKLAYGDASGKEDYLNGQFAEDMKFLFGVLDADGSGNLSNEELELFLRGNSDNKGKTDGFAVYRNLRVIDADTITNIMNGVDPSAGADSETPASLDPQLQTEISTDPPLNVTISDSAITLYATMLYDAVDGAGTDEQAIKNILFSEDFTEGDITAIILKYNELYGSKESFVQRLDDELSGNDKETVMKRYAEILVKQTADGCPRGLELLCTEFYNGTAERNTTADEFIDAIMNCENNEVISRLVINYHVYNGEDRDIFKDVKGDFSRGKEDKYIKILSRSLSKTKETTTTERSEEAETKVISDQKAYQYARQLFDSMAGWGTDDEQFEAIINDPNLTAEDWVKIISCYNDTYGPNSDKKGKSFIQAVDADFSGGTLDKYMKKLAGFLVEAAKTEDNDAVIQLICDEFYYGTAGMNGTAEQFIDALFDKTKGEENKWLLGKIGCEYSERHPGRYIKKDIEGDFSWVSGQSKKVDQMNAAMIHYSTHEEENPYKKEEVEPRDTAAASEVEDGEVEPSDSAVASEVEDGEETGNEVEGGTSPTIAASETTTTQPTESEAYKEYYDKIESYINNGNSISPIEIRNILEEAFNCPDITPIEKMNLIKQVHSYALLGSVDEHNPGFLNNNYVDIIKQISTSIQNGENKYTIQDVIDIDKEFCEMTGQSHSEYPNFTCGHLYVEKYVSSIIALYENATPEEIFELNERFYIDEFIPQHYSGKQKDEKFKTMFNNMCPNPTEMFNQYLPQSEQTEDSLKFRYGEKPDIEDFQTVVDKIYYGEITGEEALCTLLYVCNFSMDTLMDYFKEYSNGEQEQKLYVLLYTFGLKQPDEIDTTST